MTYSINSFSDFHEKEIKNLAKNGNISGYTGYHIDRFKSISIGFLGKEKIYYWARNYLWSGYSDKYLPVGLNLCKYMI